MNTQKERVRRTQEWTLIGICIGMFVSNCLLRPPDKFQQDLNSGDPVSAAKTVCSKRLLVLEDDCCTATEREGRGNKFSILLVLQKYMFVGKWHLTRIAKMQTRES